MNWLINNWALIVAAAACIAAVVTGVKVTMKEEEDPTQWNG